jgi:hypothetical protein
MLRQRLRPGDLLLSGLLGTACVLTALRLPGHPELTGPLLFHGALLAGFLVFLALAAAGRIRLASELGIAASIALVFALYRSLGLLGFELHDRTFDAPLSRIDTLLLGILEALSFVYLFYVGWVYLSIVLECFGREEEDREAFLLGLTLTYCLGYLGYLLLPAHGPIGFHAQDYAHALAGGPVFGTMTRAVESQGGAIGAFPSLHVGGAVFLCVFDLRRNRMRGYTYLPVVPLVALSTVVLRFHYVIDWVGGAAVALFALWATPRALAAWRGTPRRVPPVPTGSASPIAASPRRSKGAEAELEEGG